MTMPNTIPKALGDEAFAALDHLVLVLRDQHGHAEELSWALHNLLCQVKMPHDELMAAFASCLAKLWTMRKAANLQTSLPTPLP